MLEIKNLHVSIHGIEILKGINLKVGSGETHAIMGPNGSGKSTLAYVLAGKPGYEITKGSVLFEGSDLSTMPVEDRSRAGVIASLDPIIKQYPVFEWIILLELDITSFRRLRESKNSMY